MGGWDGGGVVGTRGHRCSQGKGGSINQMKAVSGAVAVSWLEQVGGRLHHRGGSVGRWRGSLQWRWGHRQCRWHLKRSGGCYRWVITLHAMVWNYMMDIE